MKLGFSQWLAENSEDTEMAVARFLEDILEKAADLKKQDMAKGVNQSFTAYVRQVWPGQQSSAYFLLPNTFPPEIAGKPVSFKYKGNPNDRAETHHHEGKFSGMVFNMKPLNVAKTPEEVDNYIYGLKMAAHHEADHIFSPGEEYSNPGDEDAKTDSLNYMSHPSEIRAHAREIAWAYSKKFPNQPFDVEKSRTMLNDPGFNNTHRNYLVNLATDRWAHNNVHNNLVQSVKQFMPVYQQQVQSAGTQ